jgi:hypothetical protein
MSGNDERPLRLPKSPVPRPSPQGTPEALPYPILRRLSSTSTGGAAPRAARAMRTAWPLTGEDEGDAEGR